MSVLQWAEDEGGEKECEFVEGGGGGVVWQTIIARGGVNAEVQEAGKDLIKLFASAFSDFVVDGATDRRGG